MAWFAGNFSLFMLFGICTLLSYFHDSIHVIAFYHSLLIAVKEEARVLIVATIAWGLRKCCRAIELVLIFLIAMKPGFIHAVYSMFVCQFIDRLRNQAKILVCGKFMIACDSAVIH